MIATAFVKVNTKAAQAELEIEQRRLMHAPLVIVVVSIIKQHPHVLGWE